MQSISEHDFECFASIGVNAPEIARLTYRLKESDDELPGPSLPAPKNRRFTTNQWNSPGLPIIVRCASGGSLGRSRSVGPLASGPAQGGLVTITGNVRVRRSGVIAGVGLILLVFLWTGFLTVMGAGASGYRILTRRTLGGEGFWDYLAMDADARRLYISREGHVMVVDADSYKIIGDIPANGVVHGVAVAREFGRGFASEGEAGQVTIFDLRTLKKIGTAKTGRGPDGIIYDPASKRVFAFNGQAGTATAIDAATGKVAGSVDLGGDPEFAAADGKGHVYNNLEDKSEVVQIDSRTLKVLNHWPLAPGSSPTAMAMDGPHRRLFIGCRNKLMIVMDADTGKIVADLPIGKGVDGSRFDPGTQLVFSSNGDGTLTVIHEESPDKYTVVDNITTQRGARTMELDPRTHRVFLVTAELGPQPAPTADDPHPVPSMTPGTFTLLVFGQ
jgi:DNA-binding beta-propeller fold protein YncE